MHISVLVLNLVVSIASVGWGVSALLRPAILAGTMNIDRGGGFFARMYAARAIPLGIVTGVLPFRAGGAAVAWVLFAAAAIQIADVVIAASRNERGMAFGGSVGAIVHIICGFTII